MVVDDHGHVTIGISLNNSECSILESVTKSFITRSALESSDLKTVFISSEPGIGSSWNAILNWEVFLGDSELRTVLGKVGSQDTISVEIKGEAEGGCKTFSCVLENQVGGDLGVGLINYDAVLVYSIYSS